MTTLTPTSKDSVGIGTPARLDFLPNEDVGEVAAEERRYVRFI